MTEITTAPSATPSAGSILPLRDETGAGWKKLLLSQLRTWLGLPDATTGTPGNLLARKVSGDGFELISPGGMTKDFYWEPAYTPPVLANMTALNNGTAGTCVATQNGSVIDILFKDDGGTSQQKAYADNTAISGDFDFKVKFRHMGDNLDFANVGVGIRDSSSGKMQVIRVDNRAAYGPGSIDIGQWSTWDTGGVTLYSIQGWGHAVMHGYWMRVWQDATNRNFCLSMDGINWLTIFTQVVSGNYMVPNQAILLINGGNSGATDPFTQHTKVLSWSLTP